MRAFRLVLVLAIAAVCAVPASALADTFVTGKAFPTGSDSSARLHLTVTPSCSGSPDYGIEWQRANGSEPLHRIGASAPSSVTAGQVYEGDVNATGLVAGAVYRYRATGYTYCGGGYEQTYGNYLCFMAGHTQADGTLNVSCDAPEQLGGTPDDGGGGGGAGGAGGGGGGTTETPTGNIPHLKAPGKRCLQPPRYKFNSVFDVRSKGVPCSTIYALVYSDRNRSLIGKRKKLKLKPSKFVCKAVTRRAGNADYRCAKGSKSWFMHTYASGGWTAPNEVWVDY